MEFPISGVDASPLIPVLVGFGIATMTTPVGVSGAFLLLPFQFSVLGYTTPGVTATNLLYNVISTPAGILRFRRQGDFDTELVGAIVRGAVPAVMMGAVLRVTVFEDPADFKIVIGVVLLGLGSNLTASAIKTRGAAFEPASSFHAGHVSILGGLAGLIGGIYGVSGGSIIAPVLARSFRLPVARIAPAALTATLLTSIAGVATYEVLSAVATTDDHGRRPDWLLALLFGVGGALGAYTGARLNARAPERVLRFLLGTLALALAASYIITR